VIARAEIRVEDGVLRGEPGRKHRAMPDAFKIGEHVFEPLPCRIIGARIVEPEVDAGALLFVGGRLVDRRDQRARRRIARL
jgi:hypothetical protein